MMTYDPAHVPQRRRASAPRPDYMIVQNKQVCSIPGAKYRELWEHDLPAHWLYQLAIYALCRLEGIDATILYPTMEARIATNDPMNRSNRVHVVSRPVDLLQLDQLISKEKYVVAGLALARFFAGWLAFEGTAEIYKTRLRGKQRQSALVIAALEGSIHKQLTSMSCLACPLVTHYPRRRLDGEIQVCAVVT